MKLVLFGFSLIFLLFGCSSHPASVSIQTNETIDATIKQGSLYIYNIIPANSKIAVVNINSDSLNLSNYIIDNTIMHLINTGKFIVVERSELINVQQEQQYQFSGNVSDETAISLGNQLGVQFIITGSIMPVGNNYSLRLKITNVQTAQIIGTQIYNVKHDNVLLSLINLSPSNQNESVQEVPQQVIMGDVNITNNNTTTIQGDVYVNMPRIFDR